MPQLRTSDTSIDGIRLITTELDVWKAAPLWAKLASIVSPALVHLRTVDRPKVVLILGKLFAANTQVKDIDAEQLGELVAALGPAASEAMRLLEPRLQELSLALFASTLAISDGVKYSLGGSDKLSAPEAIAAAFGGRMGAYMKALWWLGRFNFAGFFSSQSGAGVATPALATA